jgi:hypothetical protein
MSDEWNSYDVERLLSRLGQVSGVAAELDETLETIIESLKQVQSSIRSFDEIIAWSLDRFKKD